MRGPKQVSLILTIILAGVLCFFKLADHQVQQWDEQTNIDVVDETLRFPPPDKGELEGVFDSKLILHYNGKPFFEKPPLWYWGSMAIIKIHQAVIPASPESDGQYLALSDSPIYRDSAGRGQNDNVFSYRFISALSGAGLTFLIYLLGKKFWGHWAGIVSSLSLLSIGHFFINNVSGYFSTHNFRSADLDALQLLFMMLSFWFFVKATPLNPPFLPFPPLRLAGGGQVSGGKVQSPPPENGELEGVNLTLAFAFSGLAIMTKGFLGLLPIAIFLLFQVVKLFRKSTSPNPSLLRRGNTNRNHHSKTRYPILEIRYSKVRSKPEILSSPARYSIPIIVLLSIILPWHLFMYLRFGQKFVDQYFIYHTVRRATEVLELHHENWWFYLQMIFNVKVFSFGFLLPISLFLMIKSKAFISDLKLFGTVAGVVIPLVIFTLIPTTLAWYQLYIYPFAALSFGYLFTNIQNIKSNSLRFASLIIFVGLIFTGMIQNLLWILRI